MIYTSISYYHFSGLTPQRCEFKYPKTLTKTESHPTLLERFRATRRVSDQNSYQSEDSGSNSRPLTPLESETMNEVELFLSLIDLTEEPDEG